VDEVDVTEGVAQLYYDRIEATCKGKSALCPKFSSNDIEQVVLLAFFRSLQMWKMRELRKTSNVV